MYSGRKDKKKIKRKMIAGCMAALVGIAVFCALAPSFSGKDGYGGERFWGKAVVWMQGQMNRIYLPVFAFLEEETGIHKSLLEVLEEILFHQAPVYKYSEEQAGMQVSIEDEDTYDILIRQEGTDEEYKGVEDGSLEYGEDALHIDGDLEKGMLEENNSYNEKKQKEEEEEK